jgi:hydroxymethylbilane synthase
MTVTDLPAGALVGTGSPRRMAQIRSLRADLSLVAVRGNVGTRLARVTPGDRDAVVLAAAGLQRLGLRSSITQEFDPVSFLPAPAQGALAVECRDEKSPWFDAGLRALDDPASRWAAIAERAVLTGLEAGCSAPVSALGRFTDRRRGGTADPLEQPDAGPAWLTLSGQATSLDGSEILRRDMIVGVSDDVSARTAGLQLASQLLSDGAAELVHGL